MFCYSTKKSTLSFIPNKFFKKRFPIRINHFVEAFDCFTYCFRQQNTLLSGFRLICHKIVIITRFLLPALLV